MRVKDEAALKRHLKYWQKRMNLRDWKLEVRMVDEIEMVTTLGEELVDCPLGVCMPSPMRKRATILILDPQDSRYAGEDLELVLVHELSHLYFAIYSNDTILFEENQVCAISEAMMNLKYGVEIY